LRGRAPLPELPFSHAPHGERPVCVHQHKPDGRDSEKTNDEEATAISDKQDGTDCLPLIKLRETACHDRQGTIQAW
jgi:hypothetical protein